MNQPLRYKEARFWLRAGKYSCAVIASFVLLTSGTLALGITILLLPYFVERLLYWFCRRKAVKELVELLSNKNGKYDDIFNKDRKPMSHYEAKGAAKGMIDDDIKWGRMWF